LPRQTSLLDAVWIPAKDGNFTGMDIFQQHYTARADSEDFPVHRAGGKDDALDP
jgi:hypothetical protein